MEEEEEASQGFKDLQNCDKMDDQTLDIEDDSLQLKNGNDIIETDNESKNKFDVKDETPKIKEEVKLEPHDGDGAYEAYLQHMQFYDPASLCNVQIKSDFLQSRKGKLKKGSSLKLTKNGNLTRKHFKCDTCGKSFHQKYKLELHKKEHTGGMFECEECDDLFATHKELKAHKNLVHQLKKTYPGKEKAFACDFCSKSFQKEASYNAHVRQHTGEKPYICVLCKKSFSEPSKLKRHVMTHTGERPYKCSFCEKDFIYPGDLKSHERIHLGIKPFPCDQCEESFTDKGKLKYHKRQNHGNFDFKCDQCPKAFNFVAHLNVHKRVHSGEKPFCCDICGMAFHDNNIWRQHKRKHVKVVGLKFPCTEPGCEKVFSQAIYLKRHLKLHTGVKKFQCEYCFKSFAEVGNLRQHLKTHTGERPFNCDVCNKAFARQGNLDVHKRIHTGEKPYACDQCEMRYTENVHLKRHKAKEHGPNQINNSTGHLQYAEENSRGESSDYDHSEEDGDIKASQLNTEHTQHVENVAREQQSDHRVSDQRYIESMMNDSQFQSNNLNLDHGLNNVLNFSQSNIQMVPDKLFNCDRCSSSFTTRSYLDVHLRIVHMLG